MTRIRDIATEKSTLAIDDDFVCDPQSGATFKMKAGVAASQLMALFGLQGLLDAKAPVNHNHSLSLLADTNIGTPNIGDLVQWNGSKWVSAVASSAASQRNRMLNSAMRISQESGSSPVSHLGWPVDGCQFINLTDATATAAQITQNDPRTPGGSPNRIRVVNTVIDASIGAGQAAHLLFSLEGFEIADLSFGSSSAKSLVVSFGVKAPAGTYCVALRNAVVDRAWIGEFTITAPQANVDTAKTVTLVADTTGTWQTGNAAGAFLTICLACGSTFQGATGWQAGNKIATSNQFNLFASTSNVFELFDIALYPGVTPPAYEIPPYEFVLQRCMRRYQKRIVTIAGYGAAGGTVDHNDFLPVAMRAAPGPTFSSITYGNASGLANNGTTDEQLNLTITPTALGRAAATAIVVLDARI